MSGDDSNLHPVERLANEFMRRRQDDPQLSAEDFAALHPEYEEELRDFIDVQTLFGLATEDVDTTPPPTTIGPYEVLRQLGRGGMGIVYLATDPQLNRRVAIKRLTHQKSADETWIARFRREAQMASALNHPNILTVYEVGRDGDAHYLATEFVEGETLRQKLQTGRLRLEDVIDWSGQLIAAIQTAHANRVIHRDLKPDNVMIRQDGLLKVLDFGLAKPAALELGDSTDITALSSSPGAVIGTFRYTSPEQARGQEVNCPTDIFAFGILVYQMLTGEHPFEGDSASDVMASILRSPPRPFGDRKPTIPVALKQLVLDCLEKEPDRRPVASEISSRIRSLGSDTGLQQPPVGKPKRIPDDSTIAEPSAAGSSVTGDAIADAFTADFSADGFPANEKLVSGSPTRLPDATKGNDSGTVRTSAAPDDLSGVASGIRYARSGDVNIAWQTIGDGPIDLVFVMGWVSHLDWFWREPSFADFLRRLARFCRVILFDKRGTGLSDRVPDEQLPSLEQRMDDVRAVMDAAKSEKAVLCGVSEGGPMCSLFAATYPHKTTALVMIGSYARRIRSDDYPWGPTTDQRERFLIEIEKNWGGPVGIEDRAPSLSDDPAFREWWATYLRMGASPRAAVTLTRMNAQVDIRPILSSIQVPTLVVHRSGDRCLNVEEGRYLAGKIPGAKFVELPGDDHLPFVGDRNAICTEIEQFLTGYENPSAIDRVLATVVSVKVDGKAADQELFREPLQRTLELFRGQHFRHEALAIENTSEINEASELNAASEIIVTFDGPGRAVYAAKAVCDLAGRFRLETRCGVHTGACDVYEDRATGATVQRAQGISSAAPAGAIHVTESVISLISETDLHFARRDGDPAEAVLELQPSRTDRPA